MGLIQWVALKRFKPMGGKVGAAEPMGVKEMGLNQWESTKRVKPVGLKEGG